VWAMRMRLPRFQPSVDVRPFATSLCAATLCAALTLGPPAHAAYLDQDFQDASQRVERSLITLADATYGILKGQTSETTSGFISAVIDVGNGADDKELASLVDRGLDVALSLPVQETTGALKDAFAGLSTDTCQMVPLSRASIDQLLRPNTLASVDPAKRKASTERYAATLEAVPRTDMGVCLPSATGLERLAVSSLGRADEESLRRLQSTMAAALKSVPKERQFKLLGELKKRQSAALAVGRPPPGLLRDRFVKSLPEYSDARKALETIRKAREAGPPKCFTIGCQANYEYDIWRYDGKDDYTGEGLEKPNGILKPKGFVFEGTPE